MSKIVTVPNIVSILPTAIGFLLCSFIVIAFGDPYQMPGMLENCVKLEVANNTTGELSHLTAHSIIQTEIGNLAAGDVRTLTPVLSNDGCLFMPYFSYLDTRHRLHVAQLNPAPSLYAEWKYLVPSTSTLHIKISANDRLTWYITDGSTKHPKLHSCSASVVAERFSKIRAPKTFALLKPIRILIVPDFSTIGMLSGYLKLEPRIMSLRPQIILFYARDIYNNCQNNILSNFPASTECSALFDRLPDHKQAGMRQEQNYGYSQNGLVGISDLVRLDQLAPDAVDIETIWPKNCKANAINAHKTREIGAATLEGIILKSAGFKPVTTRDDETYYSAFPDNYERSTMQIIDVIP